MKLADMKPEIFMLLNGGGTEQDPEHMAKVAGMASGD